jgi:hypothetical protein
MTYQEFTAKYNLTLTAERTNKNSSMTNFNGDHYKVTLKHSRRRMTLIFSKGYGHNGQPPTVDEVFCCLACDYQIENEDFESFCNEMGYDNDSRSAERTFNAVKQQNIKLEKFLGALLNELISCEEV